MQFDNLNLQTSDLHHGPNVGFHSAGNCSESNFAIASSSDAEQGFNLKLPVLVMNQPHSCSNTSLLKVANSISCVPQEASKPDTYPKRSAFSPKNPTTDAIIIANIPTPETQECIEAKAGDGDTLRMDSFKAPKPVLGKAQAKKRLMAFVNKFGVVPKVQNIKNKPEGTSKLRGTEPLKGKVKPRDKVKSLLEELNNAKLMIESALESQQRQENHHYHISGKSRKRPEKERILAIEEIVREESMSKMVPVHLITKERSISDSKDEGSTTDIIDPGEKERRNEEVSSQLSSSKKFSNRLRQRGKERKIEHGNNEAREKNTNKEQLDHRSSQDNEQRRKDKDRKQEKVKYERARNRKDRERKRELEKCNSWAELKKASFSSDEIVLLRRREYSDRFIKNRTAQDFARYLEQMLMLGEHRLKRYPLIAEGFEGSTKFHPESVRVTKRSRGLPILYCENPRVSLLLNRQQIFQAVTSERREKIKAVCEATRTRIRVTEIEDTLQHRTWYQKMDSSKFQDIPRSQLLAGVHITKSKWDSDDDIALPTENVTRETENKIMEKNEKEACAEIQPFASSSSLSTETRLQRRILTSPFRRNSDHDNNNDNDDDDDDDNDNNNDNDDEKSCPSPKSTGDEKLVSEYEQFMKMVSNDISVTVSSTGGESSLKITTEVATSPSTYHEFNLENLLNPMCFKLSEEISNNEELNKMEDAILREKQKGKKYMEKTEIEIIRDQAINPQQRLERDKKSERENVKKNTGSDESCSIPSDWENVKIKVERLSDENSEIRNLRKGGKQERKRISRSESLTSESEGETEKKAEMKRKKKKRLRLVRLESSSDSESSMSSTSSTSTDEVRKKKRRKKKKRKERERKKIEKKLKDARKKHGKRSSIDSCSSNFEERELEKVGEAFLKRRKKNVENKDVDENTEDRVRKGESLMFNRNDQNKMSVTVDESCEQLESKSIEKMKEEKEEEMEGVEEGKNVNVKWSEEVGMLKDICSGSIPDMQKYAKDREKNKKDENTEKHAEEQKEESARSTKQIMHEMDKSKKVKRGIMEEDMESRGDEKNKVLVSEKEDSRDTKVENEDKLKKRKKRSKGKKSNCVELLAEWERESRIMTSQIMQEMPELSKKLERKSKVNWRESEFDTLNVPSLTQLEKAAGKREIFTDDWEVDSLEAAREPTITSKKISMRSGIKRLEKEVKYDKKTDTYISVERESTKETKKRQSRLCAIRIWEEEQEEGEKEEIMLMEERSKRKREEWNVEKNYVNGDTILRTINKHDNLPKDDSGQRETVERERTKVFENRDNKLEKRENLIDIKKNRKSRWDVEGNSEEVYERGRIEDNDIPVMWEKEARVDWSKNPTFNIERFAMLQMDQGKLKVEKEKTCIANLHSKINKSLEKPINTVPIDQIQKTWSTESRKRFWPTKGTSTCNLNLNASLNELTEEHISSTYSWNDNSQNEDCTVEELNKIMKLGSGEYSKKIELYSPSSPAFSQRSEDMDISSDSAGERSLVKEENEKEEEISISNIPLPSDTFPKVITNLVMPIAIEVESKKCAMNSKDEKAGNKEEEKNLEENFTNKLNLEAFDKSSNSSFGGEACMEMHTATKKRMDMFAEYESENELDQKLNSEVNDDTLSSAIKKKDVNEEKLALKLIPKQILIRRCSEAKSKEISNTPVIDTPQHATVCFKIQKKVLHASVLQSNTKEGELEESACEATSEFISTFPEHNPLTFETNNMETTPHSEAVIFTKTKFGDEEISELLDRKGGRKEKEEVKTKEVTVMKEDIVEIMASRYSRSLSREHVRKNSSKKERENQNEEGRGKDVTKDIKDKEKTGKKEYRNVKLSHGACRRRSSPVNMCERKRKSSSPLDIRERKGSRSKSKSRSWSRSRSRSPRRKEDTAATFNSRERERKLSKSDDERPVRSKIPDDRRERTMQSPTQRHVMLTHSKDNVARYATTTSKRDRERSRRKGWDDSVEREREREKRSYDPMEILRGRNLDLEKHRGIRFLSDEGAERFWRYEGNDAAVEDDESANLFVNGRDLNSKYEERMFNRDESLERDINEGPIRSPVCTRAKHKSRGRYNEKQDKGWQKEKDSSDLERNGQTVRRNRRTGIYPKIKLSPRSRRSARSSVDRYKVRSKSRSRSRSRSRLRSPERRSAERPRQSRSISPIRGRDSERARKAEVENGNAAVVYGERGRHIETIVQTSTGVMTGSSVLDSEILVGADCGIDATSHRYSNESDAEVAEYYYYSESNLTYPPLIDEAASSPKRLSLDDRLELELGIKTQHQREPKVATGYYPTAFSNYTSTYPLPSHTSLSMIQQQQSLYHRQQPTVLQVGNVLQVVPADFTGVPPSVPSEISTGVSAGHGSSHVVRVGNVLQVVPTASLDWSSSPSMEQQGTHYSAGVPTPSPISAVTSASSIPVSLPEPVPVPTTVSVIPSIPLSLPIPLTSISENDVIQNMAQPVYNYEAILEVRRKEREIRKRLKQERKKEKERRKAVRTKRRIERLYKKSLVDRRLDGSIATEGCISSSSIGWSISKICDETDDEDRQEEERGVEQEGEDDEEVTERAEEELVEGEDEEEEDEDENDGEDDGEGEEDGEEEEDREEEDDEEEEEKEMKRNGEVLDLKEVTLPRYQNHENAMVGETTKEAAEGEKQGVAKIEENNEWPLLPPPPLKGILISPGFGKDSMANGNTEGQSDQEEEHERDKIKRGGTDGLKRKAAAEVEDKRSGSPKAKLKWRQKQRKSRRSRMCRKSVQFADGVKPGEGTSPSGGEGDMPSPPPPVATPLRDASHDSAKRSRIRKSRKKQKRTRQPKTKKKVKVKIIKLKKPRITPLNTMLMQDLDEIDDRSPPPPPPGSPPPPHLWPSYLATYNATLRAMEPLPSPLSPLLPTASAIPALPPPTPLPLLIPPPPLNYTMQPCNKV